MRAFALIMAVVVCASAACADPAPRVQPVKATAALAAPMVKLAFLRGVWAGPAKGTTPHGKPYTVMQTERIGPMLGGDIIVIEGRGYLADGSTAFNAFGVVSFDPRTQHYELRSYAQGQAGTFELELTGDGFVWEIPAGPDAAIRFTSTVKDNHWREVGEYIAKGKPPVQTYEMNLARVGDTDWPLTTPVAPSIASRRTK